MQAVYSHYPIAVDDQLAVLCLYFAVEMAMDAVVLGHVYHVVQIYKRVIDADDFVLFPAGLLLHGIPDGRCGQTH